MGKTLTVRLPPEILLWIEERAQATKRSKGSLIKEAIEQLRRDQSADSKPFMKLAGTFNGPADLSSRKGFSGK